MGLFSRLFRWGQSEAHSVMDKLENPVKMTEQGIRTLRKDLEHAIKDLAHVKALAIKSSKEATLKKQLANDYENKAMLLLKRGQSGVIETEEADRLASEALKKKEEVMAQALTATQNLQMQEDIVNKMEVSIKKMKAQVSSWETELGTLKARAKVANASQKLNQHLAKADSNGTIAMLERMKDRVAEHEALAESYGELAASATDIDDEIDRALEDQSGSAAASDALSDLKAKMALKK
ncbi:MAG: PspA/IM30 family protein [Bacteriovoracaceae bacterium]|nr:PspA/IM30 family protein [Bacteriovoracaceae bacterium]